MTPPRPSAPGGAGVLGAVLAGGAGRRLGGRKPLALVAGRPLLLHPLAVVRSVLPDVVVVAKRAAPLPPLPPDVPLEIEPDEPRHPLCGIVHALRVARGRAVLVCAADLPLLEAAVLRRLLAAARPADAAVVPAVGGRLQPLLALYAPAALAPLAGQPPDVALTAAVRALRPRVLPWPRDERAFFNVNTPADLRRAEALLAGRPGR